MRSFLVLCAVGLVGCGKRTADIGPDPAKSAAPVDRSHEVFLDGPTSLMWTRAPSAPMSWKDARAHCGLRVDGGYNDWRLPLRAEIEGLGTESLREPFATMLPPPGYLFSGEVVAGVDDQPWIMNLRNAHVFNGHRYQAVVLCVRRP